MCRTGPSVPCLCVLPSKKWWFLILSFSSILPISQIIVGSLYRRKCPQGFHLSLWNLVSGILLLCAISMEAVYSAVMRIRVPKRSTYPLEKSTQNVKRHTVTPRRVIFYPLMVILFQISIAVSSGFGLYLIYDVSCQKFFDIFTMGAVYLHLFGVMVVPAFCCVSYIWFRNDDSEDEFEQTIGSSFPEKNTYPTYPPRKPTTLNLGANSAQVSALQDDENSPYSQNPTNMTYLRPGRSVSLGSSGEFLGANTIRIDDSNASKNTQPPKQLMKGRSKTDYQKPVMQRVALSGTNTTYENIERRSSITTQVKSNFIHGRIPDKSIRFNLPGGYGDNFSEGRNRIPVTTYQTRILKEPNNPYLPLSTTSGNYRTVSPLRRNSPIEGRVKSLPLHRNMDESDFAGSSVKREPLLSTFASPTNRSQDNFFQLKTDIELQSNV